MFTRFAIGLGLLCCIGIQAQINQKEAIQDIIAYAKEQKSARIMLSFHDSLVVNETFYGKPNEQYRIYSITKMLSGLAVAFLYEKRYIKSVEEPLANYITSWQNDSIKSNITFRHVLQHYTGLEGKKGSMDIYDQPDYFDYAIAAKSEALPGENYFYNNRAFNLLSGIVKKLTQQSMAQFLQKVLFDPLGIDSYVWKNDSMGNSWAMDGVQLSANDLWKIGVLLANKGVWQEKVLLSPSWFSIMYQLPLKSIITKKGGYGLGVRVLYLKDKFKIPASSIALLLEKEPEVMALKKLKDLGDQVFKWDALAQTLTNLFDEKTIEQITALAYKHHLPLITVEDDDLVVCHSGEIGQLVMVYPKKKMVFIRFIGEKWGRKEKPQGGYVYDNTDAFLPYLLKITLN